MSKQSKQGIANDAVDGDKIRLLNNQSIRARNFAGSADVDVLKLNASDEPEFLTMPTFAGSPFATEATSLDGKTTDDLDEGATNFYFTSGRFDTAFAVKDTGDLAEGSNLYYTSGRFDSAFAAKDTDDLSQGASNFYYSSALFDSDFSGKDTGDLSEGSNLYYTAARFNTAFAAKSTTDLSEGSNLYYTAARFNTAFSGKSTTDLAEGTNLYYTAARFNTAFSGKSTTDLSEGSNLYFTNARAIGALLTGYTSGAGVVAATDSILQAIQKLNGNIAAVSGSTVTSVNSISPVSGNVSLTTNDIPENTNLYYTAARFNSAFAGKSTSDLSEGINLYYTAARFNTAFAGKSTTDLAEGSNLYYTNARGIASVLTGYTSGAGTVAASDTILQAIQKLNGNTALKQDAATAVTSVNSVTPTAGNVVLTTSNVAEGSNLYSTTARILAALVFSQAVPTGTPNGVLANFTLPFTPHSDGAMIVFVDAVPKVVTTEWTRSGTTLTFTAGNIPAAGQQIYVWMLRA